MSSNFNLRELISGLDSISSSERKFLERLADELESEYGEEYSDKFLETLRRAYFYAGMDNIEFKASLWTMLLGLVGVQDYKHTYESRKSNHGCALAQDVLRAAIDGWYVRDEILVNRMSVLYTTYCLVQDERYSFYDDYVSKKYDTFSMSVMKQRDLQELIKETVSPEEYKLFLRECENFGEILSSDKNSDAAAQLSDALCRIVHEIEPYFDESVFPSFGSRGADEYYLDEDEKGVTVVEGAAKQGV